MQSKKKNHEKNGKKGRKNLKKKAGGSMDVLLFVELNKQLRRNHNRRCFNNRAQIVLVLVLNPAAPTV